MTEIDGEGGPASEGAVATTGGFDVEYGNVEKCGVLGQGGNATVHEARVDGRRIALKEPHLRDDGVADRFRREAETWERLDDHEGVVGVLGWGTDPRPWIALELAEGGDLRDREHHSLPDALRIARDVADAVHHAHRHGVLHLDLKPDNVLFRSVDGRDRPAVADWGIARPRAEGGDAAGGSPSGAHGDPPHDADGVPSLDADGGSSPDADRVSPPYAAPEQLAPGRFGGPDERTDVYQLGALCYRLLTGDDPHAGRSGTASVLDGDPPRPTDVDPALPDPVDDVVARAMATDPADRHASVLALRRDLDDLRSSVASPGSGGDDGTADGDAAGRPGTGDYGTAAGLERQGFVRPTDDYFDRRDPAPPTRAWRAGLRLVDVYDGAAVDRRVDRDGERVDLTDHLHECLGDGEDLVVVGPPGAGKSTACKQVACAWHAAGRGPVLYRESGGGDRLDAPSTLRRHLDGTDGHALVVVEDAVRPEASAVFDAVEAFEGDGSVTFLLDARRGEWADAGIHLDGERDRTRRRAVEVVSLPRPARDEYERFVDAVGRTVDAEVDVSVGDLLPEVRAAAAGEDRTPGELFLLLHRLLAYVDVLDAETGVDDAPETTLDDAVRLVRLDLESQGETALDVGVAANLLNAAGVGVRPELLHAVAPEEDAAVAEAIDALEGRVLFADDRDEHVRSYRAVHEVWSAEFLAHLLDADGEAAAHERVGRVLSRLLALADDPEPRDQLAWVLRGETDYLARIADDPGEWADAVVEDVFALGTEWPKLAPLFGTTGDSTFDLPDACSAAVRARRAEWRGDAYRRAGDYDRAEREYDRLAAVAEGGETGTVDADLLRARSRFGVGTVSLSRGEFDAAVEAAEAGLSSAPDGSRERCELLGVVAGARRHMGDYDATLETTERQRELAEALDARDLQAAAIERRGTVTLNRGEFHRARESFKTCLEIRRELGDRLGEGTVLTSLGNVAQKLGEYERARERHERSLAIKRELGDRKGEARQHNNLGGLLVEGSEYDSAREYFERSLSIKRDIGDREGEATVLNNLGYVMERLGNYDLAQEYKERSLEITRAIGDRRGEANSITNLGSLFTRQGEYDRARDCHERCIEIAREIGDRWHEAGGLLNLGMAAEKEGAHDEARDHYRTALDAFETIDNPSGVAQVRVSQARLALETDDAELARTRVERAYDIFEDGGMGFWAARSRYLFGRVEVASGSPDAAREHWRAALQTFDEVGAPEDALETLEHLVETCREEGHDDRARGWWCRAREILDDAPEGVADGHREWVESHAGELGID